MSLSTLLPPLPSLRRRRATIQQQSEYNATYTICQDKDLTLGGHESVEEGEK